MTLGSTFVVGGDWVGGDENISVLIGMIECHYLCIGFLNRQPNDVVGGIGRRGLVDDEAFGID